MAKKLSGKKETRIGKASPAESDLDSFVVWSMAASFGLNRHKFVAAERRGKSPNGFCFWGDWMMALQLMLARTTSASDRVTSLAE
jgi:hypothetical protein